MRRLSYREIAQLVEYPPRTPKGVKEGGCRCKSYFPYMKNKKIGKKQIFVISVEPYKQECIVVVNGSFSDAYNLMKKLSKTSKNAGINISHIDENKEEYFKKDAVSTEGCLYTELPFGYIMLVKHLGSWLDTVGLVSHESLHLTQYILRKVGIKELRESEEAYTYTQEKILKDILKEMY